MTSSGNNRYPRRSQSVSCQLDERQTGYRWWRGGRPCTTPAKPVSSTPATSAHHAIGHQGSDTTHLHAGAEGYLQKYRRPVMPMASYDGNAAGRHRFNRGAGGGLGELQDSGVARSSRAGTKTQGESGADQAASGLGDSGPGAAQPDIAQALLQQHRSERFAVRYRGEWFAGGFFRLTLMLIPRWSLLINENQIQGIIAAIDPGRTEPVI